VRLRPDQFDPNVVVEVVDVLSLLLSPVAPVCVLSCADLPPEPTIPMPALSVAS
jgi:hypothetical protein